MARGNVQKGGTGGGGSARKRAGARKTALGPVRMEGVSDIGRASANQDRFLTRELRVGSGRTAFLCAVADGSRTESGARSASEIALAKLDARLQEDWDSLSDVDKARAFLRQAFVMMNAGIVAEGGGKAGHTTLTIAAIIDGELVVANVGDSRCYLVTPRQVKKITTDHNSVQEAIEKGTPEDKLKPLVRAAGVELIRKLGDSAPPEVDIFPEDGPGISLEEGSFIFLCTDGVTGPPLKQYIKPTSIQQTLYGTFDPMAAVQHLVSLSYKKGSRDNLTAVALEYGRAQRGAQIETLPRIEELRRRERTGGAPAAKPAERAEAPARGRPSGKAPAVPPRAGRPSLVVLGLVFLAGLGLGLLLHLLGGDSLREKLGVFSPPDFAGIRVSTNPPGAEATLDGKRAGLTPFEHRNLKPGERRLTLEMEGFETEQRDVNLPTGILTSMEIELQPEEPEETKSTLYVKSVPESGAQVFIDGEPVTRTPQPAEIEPGMHQLRVELAGYLPYESQIRAVAGKPLEIQADLKSAETLVKISSDPTGAEIQIDGRDAGTAPLEKKGLSPGVHRIRAKLPGYITETTEIDIQPGSTTGVGLNMALLPEDASAPSGPDIRPALAEVEALLAAGRRFQAWARWEELLLDGLSPEMGEAARGTLAKLGQRLPHLSLQVRFGDADGGLLLEGTRSLPEQPAGVPLEASPDGTFGVEVYPPSNGSLRLCLVQFALNRKKAFRLLPDGGRIPEGTDVPVPEMGEAWTARYGRGAREIYLFALIATPSEISLADIDGKIRTLAPDSESPEERGRAIVAGLEEWLSGSGHDHTVRYVWMADRKSAE